MLLVQFGNGTSEMLPELGLEAEAATAQDSTNAVAIQQATAGLMGLLGLGSLLLRAASLPA